MVTFLSLAGGGGKSSLHKFLSDLICDLEQIKA